jgi:hypothetical protein
MIISGKGSDRDISEALKVLQEKQVGTTHEISKNTQSCSESPSSSVRQLPDKFRGSLSEMVPDPN